MKILSFSRGNFVRGDKLRPYTRIWESPDGYHPIESTSKYDDEERVHPSVVFLYEDVLYPDGADEDSNKLIIDQAMYKMSGNKIRHISTLLSRMFAAIAPYLIFIIIAVIIVTMIMIGGPQVIKVIK